MIASKKAKTAAGKRALKQREPVDHEGPKTAVFLKGTTTSQVVGDALKDLVWLHVSSKFFRYFKFYFRP